MAEAAREEVTRIMVGVNESSMKGYPYPSISSKGAFEWTIKKIVRNNVSAFNLLFIHVQVPDEDGSLSLASLFFVLRFHCSCFGLSVNRGKERENNRGSIRCFRFLILLIIARMFMRTGLHV